jgi:hypothetical protein
MKPVAWAVALLMFAGLPAAAQQSSDQKQDARPSKPAGTKAAEDIDGFTARRKARPTVPVCADLGTEGTVVDKLFDVEGNPVFDLVDDAGKPYGPLSPDTPDSLWNRLIDCANQSHNESERADALRVTALWERWRAESFAKQRREAKLVHPASCDNLDQLRDTVSTVTAVSPESASARSMDDYPAIVEALKSCVNDITNLNKARPSERYRATVALLSFQLWDARRAEAALRRTINERTKQTDNERTKQTERQANADAAWMKDCDQIITVAGLTPNGLALYIPSEGRQFMARNLKNYPRTCLVEEADAAGIAPSVPHYLLVWAYSEAAFAGFQPVQQGTTSPVSGSGTVTNAYGDRWNVTYSGTATVIDMMEVPYVLQSRALYLNAYDAKGNLVSHHSITASSQAGGDASYAAGYNAGTLISLLWNNPSHLIKVVLKDVQKASGH